MACRQTIKLAYKVFNSSQGYNMLLNPVIFMHAMLGSNELWEKIPQHVANFTGRRVYAYDARNHGDSEHTFHSDFRHNLDDLYTFMDRMEIKKSVLVGHSFGGITAISAALKEPEKVERAFIVDMHVKKIPSELIDRSITFMNNWTDVVRRLPKYTAESDITRISISQLYANLPDDMKLDSEKEAYLLSKFLYKRTPEGGFDMRFNNEALTKALKNYKENPIVHSGKYDGPAFFIYGSKSPFNVGSDEANIKSHFPNAVMKEFKNCSHHLFTDRPVQFVEFLISNMGPNRYIERDR